MIRLALGLVLALTVWAATERAARSETPDRFSLDDAYRETLSPQRVRISLNGLWRFQPAQDVMAVAPPKDNWAQMRVPGRWNAENVAYGGFTPTTGRGEPLSDWNGISFNDISSAWYQREFVVPPEWAGRRILLRFDHIGVGVEERVADYIAGGKQDESLRNSAVVILNGQRAKLDDEWTVDVSAQAAIGKANMLTVGIRNFSRTRWGKGINGDVWLECEPQTRIADYDWATSFPDRRLTIHAVVRNGADAQRIVSVRAALNGKAIGESSPVAVGPGDTGNATINASVPSLAPWSEFDPQLTELRLEVVDGSQVLDTRNGKIAMRDWRIEPDGVHLNGKRTDLRTEGGPSIGVGLEIFDRDFVRNYLSAYRAAHYNGFRSLWGLVPDYVYDLTDEMGLMVQQVVPSPAMFSARTGIKDEAQLWPVYRAALAAQIGRTRRHVSVVAYDMWAHESDDRLQNQPDHIDGRWVHQVHTFDRERAIQLKAVELLHQLDPSREVLLDETNDLGKMIDVHPYFDFSMPVQEWEDWPERRVMPTVKPLNAAEFGLPYVASWGEWDSLNWNVQGAHTFILENAARYLGDDAYTRSRSAMLPDDWLMRGMGYVDQSALDPSISIHDGTVTRYRPNPAAEEVSALIAKHVFRAWRTAHVNLGPFTQDTETGASMLFRPMNATLAPPDDSLKTPGPKPNRIFENAGNYQRTALPVASGAIMHAGHIAYDPTKVFEATKEAFEPVLIYIGGDPDLGLTSKDHAFSAGESITKSIVVVNDGLTDLSIAARWTLASPDGKTVYATGSATVAAPQGLTTSIPLHMTAPKVAGRTAARLILSAAAGGREIAQDGFDLQIFPADLPPLNLPPNRKIALFDKVGDTAKALDAMGVAYKRLDRLDQLSDTDMLIIGARSLDESARELGAQIEKGLRVLVFEQKVGALSELAAHTGSSFDTTHMAATAARIVFPTDPASPVLAGIEAQDLADWRGASDFLPAYAPASATSYLYRVGGAEKFRGSNRGIVASYVLPKPQQGNFRVILSSGFDMWQTPLVEYFHGNGRVLMFQLDATRRYGRDPVATRLLRNAVSYMAADEPMWTKVGYLGDERGATAFKAMGAGYQDASRGFPANLQNFDTILVGDGGDRALRSGRDAVLAWIKRGGKLIICNEVLERIDPDFFPDFPSVEQARLVKGRFPSGEPLLRGLTQADTYIRAGITFTRIIGRHGADEVSVAQVIHVGQGALITIPLTSTAAPAIVRRANGGSVTPAVDKLARVTATVLTNAGVRIDVPFALDPQIVDLTGEWRFQTDPMNVGAGSGWFRPEMDDSGWRKITVPGLWAFQGVSGPPTKGGIGYDGLAWYRRSVDIPAGWKGGPGATTLVVGGIADTAEIFWNGKSVARGDNRSYLEDEIAIPLDDALVPYGGKASIAVKVLDGGPAGGMAGSVYLRKDAGWLTPSAPVAYGEQFPNFAPDSYHYW